jgi:hypothetical protein
LPKKQVIKITIEALVASIIYLLIAQLDNIELVRSQLSDFTFKYTLKASNYFRTPSPYPTKIRIYKIDQGYLESKSLLDSHGDTVYGKTFPRSFLAEFITKIDQAPQPPLALFLDYFMEVGSASYDTNSSPTFISKDDKVFLRVLASPRKYSILLPKTSFSNFVESYANTEHKDLEDEKIAFKIREQIASGQIVFVGIDFLEDDGVVYRYNPMMRYGEDQHLYYHAALVLWQMRKHLKDSSVTINESEILNLFPVKDFTDAEKVHQHGLAVVRSNILYKPWKKENLHKKTNKERSDWNQTCAYSAYRFFHDQSLTFDNRTVIMVGVGFKGRDWHNTTLDEQQYGVLIHADALKTVLFLDGDLRLFDIWKAVLLVFVVYFVVAVLSQFLFGHTFLAKWNILQFYFEILLLFFILFGLSIWILLQYKQWFHWGLPWLIFMLDDAIVYLKDKYIVKKEAA